MEPDIRKKIFMPFIIFMVAVVVDVNSAMRGIEHHETWRIAVAGVSGALFIVAAVYLGMLLFKGRGKTV